MVPCGRMTDTRQAILSQSDAGHHPAAIADALSVSPSHVYSVLRAHRPDRARKARARVSDVPDRIAGFAGRGWKAASIAAELGISRAYVYRHMVGLSGRTALERLGLRITVVGI